MRFLLYNIRYGTGTGLSFHFPFPFSGYLKNTYNNLQEISDFIKSYNPEIIGLIEVDGGSYRSGKFHQAEIIANKLGYYYVYESKYSKTSVLKKLPLLNKQGNAFLTSKNIKSKKFHYSPVGIKRLIIELELDELTIFLVHLSLKYRHRQHQLSDLYKIIKKIRKPVIIAGDLNSLSGAREIELFLAASGLNNANINACPSYPSRAPRKQLDFILHSSEIKINHFEIPKVKFSDHLPLICDFEIIKTQNKIKIIPKNVKKSA